MSLITSLVWHFDTKNSFVYLYRLIQMFCHEYSYVLFYIIVIRLEAWLID